MTAKVQVLNPEPRSPSPVPNVQKPRSVRQRAAARLKRLKAQVAAHPTLMAGQGSVVAAWRTRGNRRLGPYFSVVFREGGRQRWIYLGTSEELAEEARAVLAKHQQLAHHRRLMAKLRRQAGASLRQCKAELRTLLAASPVAQAVANVRFLRWLGAMPAARASAAPEGPGAHVAQDWQCRPLRDRISSDGNAR
jgi:hypothetical protein